MTENEAIERIKYRIETATDIVGKGIDGKAFEDMEMAIKALSEIQQYRIIGTVKEFQEYKEIKGNSKKAILLSEESYSIFEQYMSIGTVTECRDNKELLEFLYDVINPNEMEKYISMYNAGNEKSDRSDDN